MFMVVPGMDIGIVHKPIVSPRIGVYTYASVPTMSNAASSVRIAYSVVSE
jgi:hypothetical protein